MTLNASLLYLSPVRIQSQHFCKLYSADSAPASLGNSASLSDWAFSKASLKRLASGWLRFSMAKVQGVDDCLRTLAVSKPNSQRLWLWLALTNIRSCIPYPASITSHVG